MPTGNYINDDAITQLVIGGYNQGTFANSTFNVYQATTAFCATTAVNWTTVAGNFIELTDLQLEIGSSATPFERRPYGAELALCQRYYYKTKGEPGIPTILGSCSVDERVTSVISTIPFPTTMRVAPTTVETSGTASNYSIKITGFPRSCNVIPTLNLSSPTMALCNFTTDWPSFTPGYAGYTTTTDGFLAFSAEL